MSLEQSRLEWGFWPHDEELSTELMRLLSAGQEGGAAVAECLLTARNISADESNSWHREWKRIADLNKKRGDAAYRDGNWATAQSNWRRAMNYYLAAGLRLQRSDERWRSVALKLRECARQYLKCRRPAGEVVMIPWTADHTLQAYFSPARSGDGRHPVVLCIGEPGELKEKFLCKLERQAHDRGLALLAVDLLGKGTGESLHGVIGSPEFESAIRSVIDYLVGRRDVDRHRIAVLADECGSSFVARAVASDSRPAVAVCDGGIWDAHERAFLARRRHSCDLEPNSGMAASPIALRLQCPVLITLGEQGWLRPDTVSQLVEEVRRRNSDVTLKVFSRSETAAAQGHTDNPTLANEFIFDWIAMRLGAREQ